MKDLQADACVQCNVLLGSRMFPTMKERMQYLLGRLEAKEEALERVRFLKKVILLQGGASDASDISHDVVVNFTNILCRHCGTEFRQCSGRQRFCSARCRERHRERLDIRIPGFSRGRGLG